MLYGSVVTGAQELHILQMYNLMSLDTCTLVKPSPTRDNKHLHQTQKFPKSPVLLSSYST